MSSPGKTSWPELFGQPVTPAALTIKSKRPDLTVEVLPVGVSAVPPGFPSGRVCVFFDAQDKLGRVSATPFVG